MIIKITPETDAEKARMQELEHTNVKEFFIFGNKKDADGDMIDFYDWTGSYRYLLGSLYYFINLIGDEQKGKGNMAKQADGSPKKPKMIKFGNPKDSKIEGIINPADIKEFEDMSKKIEENAIQPQEKGMKLELVNDVKEEGNEDSPKND